MFCSMAQNAILIFLSSYLISRMTVVYCAHRGFHAKQNTLELDLLILANNKNF